MWEATALTIKLAFVTSLILLVIATPMAWWLARSKAWYKELIGAVVALPLVLPPTVLGFYLLLAMGPNSVLGQLATDLLGHALPFSFEGLVFGSVVYSLPFMTQPVRNAFESLGDRPFEVAATLGASPFVTFFKVALPMARAGLLTGAILSFAHTVGEFGVVLMIGGNIPGETRVLSISIYDYVENLEWDKAHILSGGLLAFSFVTIFCMMTLERRLKARGT